MRVITEIEELATLRDSWNSLLQTSADNTLFLTHEWVWTWWRHLARGRRLNILVFERDSQTIGIVPLLRQDFRLGPVKLHVLGTIGCVNCNYVAIVRPSDANDTATSFLSYLEKEMSPGNVILRLDLVPEDSRFLSLLRHNLACFPSASLSERALIPAPYLVLPESWKGYTDSISRNWRSNLRRMKSDENQQEITYQECRPELLEQWLPELYDLDRERWGSFHIPSTFGDSDVRDFYGDIAQRGLSQGWLHFSRIAMSGKTVCMHYGFAYNGRLYYYIIARDVRVREHSIGHIHIMHLLQAAIDMKLREFDFLQGDEAYKFRWTKSARMYLRVDISRRGIRPRLLAMAFNLHELVTLGQKYGLRGLFNYFRTTRRDRNELKRFNKPVRFGGALKMR